MWLGPVPVSGDALDCRGGHSAVTVADGSEVLVFGGGNEGQVFDNVVKVATKTWSNTQLHCKGTKPSPRSSHCAAVLGNSMVVYGGMDQTSGAMHNDLFALDLETLEWSKPDVVCFGGSEGSTAQNVNTMGKRVGHACATISLPPPLNSSSGPSSSMLVIHGGFDGADFVDDICTLTQHHTTAKPGGCDSAGASSSATTSTPTIWKLDRATRVDGVAPCGRGGHSMTAIGKKIKPSQVNANQHPSSPHPQAPLVVYGGGGKVSDQSDMFLLNVQRCSELSGSDSGGESFDGDGLQWRWDHIDLDCATAGTPDGLKPSSWHSCTAMYHLSEESETSSGLSAEAADGDEGSAASGGSGGSGPHYACNKLLILGGTSGLTGACVVDVENWAFVNVDISRGGKFGPGPIVSHTASYVHPSNGTSPELCVVGGQTEAGEFSGSVYRVPCQSFMPPPSSTCGAAALLTAKEDESEASSFVAAAAKAAKEEGQHANVRRGAGGALEMDLNLGGVQTTVVGTMDASPEGAEEAEKVEGINLPFAVVPPPMPPSSGSSDGSGTVVQGVQDEVKTGPGISAPLKEGLQYKFVDPSTGQVLFFEPLDDDEDGA